jgi:hypothetical protein
LNGPPVADARRIMHLAPEQTVVLSSANCPYVLSRINYSPSRLMRGGSILASFTSYSEQAIQHGHTLSAPACSPGR